MIRRIHWRLLAGEEPPFGKSSQRRSLRITVHCPNPDALSPDDKFRLALVRELEREEVLRIADTDPDARWRLELDLQPNAAGAASGTIHGPDGHTSHHALHPRDWTDEAIRFVGVGGATDPRTQDIVRHLPFLVAHADMYRDVFITTYDEFLSAAPRWRDAYICDLTEGLRIIGLYLRFRETFTIRISERVRERLDRAGFYWILCRERLPAMWPYFSAALARGQLLKDQSEYLANTILDRSVRALQARDEVGFQFYRLQNNTTRDEMLYHFDYLTLLLSGALDAEARMAHRVYGLSKPKLRQVSFRRKEFLDELDAAGATSVTQVAREPRFVAFRDFLGALRNSVHSIGLRGMGVSRAGEPQSSVIRVFEDAPDLVQAATALGAPGALGLDLSIGMVALEPYTCAMRLTHLGLEYINQIAAATDSARILPAGAAAGQVTAGPPDNKRFDADTRRRIAALG